MGNNFEVKMNEYLPLRDVVFNTLRQAILKGCLLYTSDAADEL